MSGSLSTWWPGVGWALCTTLGIGFVTWLLSLHYRDVSIVDRIWSWLFVAAALAFAALLPATGPRAVPLFTLLLAWAVRLSGHITWRSWGAPEDRRYRAMRERNGPAFAWKSLVTVFTLQAVLAWLMAAPLYGAVAGGAPLSALDIAGLALGAFGLVYEAVADWQLLRFQRRRTEGQVLDSGLWRYSRHPNYFGECCLGWGLWLLAASAGAAWTVFAPVLLTLLLLKVSGVSLMEQDIGERRPAYRDYIARTNAFLPGPPRPKATAARATR